ncbi:MMPL family transporter [Nakamurella sp.]|uniref:MMPL family transporter n=1 Tax=Nakamurella sp. TaxID=1869182 RepID=UPI0037832CD5
MRALADLAVRRRRWIYVFWGIMLVVGGLLAGKATDSLTYDFSLPDQPGYETDVKINEIYGNGGTVPPLIAVVTVPEGTTVDEHLDEIDRLFTGLQNAVPGIRVVDYGLTKDPTFVSGDGRSAHALVFTPSPAGLGPGVERQVAPVLAQLGQQAGFEVGLTGYTMLSAGSAADGPNVLVETLIGAVGALLVLIFVFASFLALVPLLIAGVSILSTFLVVLCLTTFTEVSFVVQFLISLVGLGVAIDYSLLLVTRWREERAHGHDNAEAVRIAVQTAGHAVLSSGVTVGISLMALVAIPVPFMRSMGFAGMLIPLISTLVVLTLLPALLGGVGPRIDFPRIRNENQASRSWLRWTTGVVRHRWLAAAGATLILALLTIPLLNIKIGAARTESLAVGGPAYETLLDVKAGGAPAGSVTPIEILMDGGDPDAVAAAARQVDGVAAAFAPDNAIWRVGNAAIVTVIPTEETVDSAAGDIVQRIDDAVSGLPGVVGAAGQGAMVQDYINAVYRSFPIALALIVLATSIQLMRTFRSVLLPIKAVLLNLLSVCATFGAVVLFWQYGYGSEHIFGIDATGAITFWLPLVSFAFLFGLSMDYEVFILARMREEWDIHHDNDRAVIEGMGRTGRLVTSAALILFLAFVALTSAPGTDVKIFATALGIGILLDATVVRALLVPALVSLFGRWNWWLPNWMATVLRVQPSPLYGPSPLYKGRHRAPKVSARTGPAADAAGTPPASATASAAAGHPSEIPVDSECVERSGGSCEPGACRLSTRAGVAVVERAEMDPSREDELVFSAAEPAGRHSLER